MKRKWLQKLVDKIIWNPIVYDFKYKDDEELLKMIIDSPSSEDSKKANQILDYRKGLIDKARSRLTLWISITALFFSAMSLLLRIVGS